MNGIVWSAVLFAAALAFATVAMRWSYRIGVTEGMRLSVIADAQRRNPMAERLVAAVLDLAGQGAEEIRLVYDDTCDAWAATGTRRPTGGWHGSR